MIARLLGLLVRGYQRFISPLLPPACRYEPSCSNYALEALRVHGAFRGSWLTVCRILRCRPGPGGGCGHDPVPPPRAKRGRASREG